jgi:hypothetical protein
VSILSVSKTVLKYALALAGTPQGFAAITALGGPVAGLIARWGTIPLSNVLDSIDADEITDEAVAAALASKGGKVTPIDLATFYG